MENAHLYGSEQGSDSSNSDDEDGDMSFTSEEDGDNGDERALLNIISDVDKMKKEKKSDKK